MPTQTKQQQLGRRLRELRRAKGMILHDVGDAIGVRWSTVQAWEKGRHSPTPMNREALAKLYGVTTADLAEEFTPDRARAAGEDAGTDAFMLAEHEDKINRLIRKVSMLERAVFKKDKTPSR